MSRGRKPAGVKSIKQLMVEMAQTLENRTVEALVTQAISVGVKPITAKLYAKKALDGTLEMRQVV